MEVGVHGSCMKAHRGHRELFVADLCVRVVDKHLVDCSIDVLPYRARYPLTCPTTGRGKFLDALLFETLPQLGFAPPFLVISFLSFMASFMKDKNEITRNGDTHIYAYHRGRGIRLERDLFIITQCE